MRKVQVSFNSKVMLLIKKKIQKAQKGIENTKNSVCIIPDNKMFRRLPTKSLICIHSCRSFFLNIEFHPFLQITNYCRIVSQLYRKITTDPEKIHWMENNRPCDGQTIFKNNIFHLGRRRRIHRDFTLRYLS